MKDDALYLGHMLDTARLALAKAENKSRAAYDADENLRIVLTHLIQTIGEAARLVSERTRVAHPQIPWRQIVGMRHRIVHDYLHVDYDTVWEVVIHDLPALVNVLAAALAGE